MPVCRKCGVELVEGDTWYPSGAKRNDCICKECKKAYARQWAAANYSRSRANTDRWQRDNLERPDTNVYILYAPEVDRYKIGQSKDPERRLKQVAALSPVDIELFWWGLCPGGTEGMLRARFRDQWVRGEWFQSLTGDQIEFIKEQAIQQGVSDD